MRKIREVLRLRSLGLTDRQIAASVGVARSTIGEYVKRAAAADIVWPLADETDDAALERLLFPPRAEPANTSHLPDCAYIHKELTRKGVTLRLLWEEYLSACPDGYRYSQFCHHYHVWRGSLAISMRQIHKAGEKMFVDFAGQTVPVVDRSTGEVRAAEVFIAVMGASNYTYAEATASQSLPDWIGAHTAAYAFFGGVPHITIPDNLAAGVKSACFYEPDINPTYAEMAAHYGTVVIPARVRRPKDKAKVEVAVQIAERWVLARLRNMTFFSLAELNKTIACLLADLNNRPLSKLDGTRASLFAAIDKPALLALPSVPYELAIWKKVRPNIDYHVDIDGHFYSVPYQLRGKQMDARITRGTVEIVFRSNRVASHVRGRTRGAHTTDVAHMPASHRAHLEWTPSRLIDWAATVGPDTARLVEAIMSGRRHPEQGYRAALGIIRLAKSYPAERVEAACGRAHAVGARSYKSVALILANNLEAAPIETQEALPIAHDNIRGADYYH